MKIQVLKQEAKKYASTIWFTVPITIEGTKYKAIFTKEWNNNPDFTENVLQQIIDKDGELFTTGIDITDRKIYKVVQEHVSSLEV